MTKAGFLQRTINPQGILVESTSDSLEPRFGDGVFETMLCVGQRVVRPQLHFQRLARGLLALKIDIDLSVIEKELEQFLRQLTPAVYYRLRVQVIRAPASAYSGYQCDILPLVTTSAVEIARPEPGEIDVACLETEIASTPSLAGIKHLNRIGQVLAGFERQELSRQWDDKIQDGLLFDGENKLVEAVAANVFLLIEGQWITPCLRSCGVEGTCRQFLLDDLLPSLGLAVKVAEVDKSELAGVSAMFLCNAIAGVVLASRLWLDEQKFVQFEAGGVEREIQRQWFASLTDK